MKGDAARALSATIAGNAVEWYEFGLYGLLSVYIGTTFFPSDDPLASAIGAWTVFAVAFVVRPFGGWALGRLGQRIGPRALLVLTVAAMGAATVGIGLVPSYAAIGIAAPIIVVAMRATQGASAGAEMTSAISYVVDTRDTRRAGPAIGALGASTYAAAATGGLLALALTITLDGAAMEAWGWRIPFLAALPLTLLALHLRRRAPSDPSLARATPVPLTPAMDAGTSPLVLVLRYVGAAAIYNMAAAVVFGGFLTHLHLAGASATLTQALPALMLGVTCACAPLSGLAVRRFGTRSVLIVSATLLAVASWPAFVAGHHGGIVALAGAVAVAIPTGGLVVPAYLLITEMFSVRERLTWGSLAYNITALLAGLVPVTVLLIRQRSGFALGFPAILTVAAAVSIVCAVAALPGARRDPQIHGSVNA